jgi:hypothetical protein
VEIGVQRVDFERRGQDGEEGFPVGGQGHRGLEYADALTKLFSVHLASPPCILPQRNGRLNIAISGLLCPEFSPPWLRGVHISLPIAYSSDRNDNINKD